jgi:hypothetical protein
MMMVHLKLDKLTALERGNVIALLELKLHTLQKMNATLLEAIGVLLSLYHVVNSLKSVTEE